MQIKNLKHIGFGKIIECLNKSFKDYFVPIPTTLTFWERKFIGARVNLELSYGAFKNDELIGLVVNGIDNVNGKLTAFNTGTGVIEKHRNKNLVGQIYQYAFPFLKKNGIQQCQLEVIDKNSKAIRVYERVGFENIRKLKCYIGELKPNKVNITIKKVPFSEVINKNDIHYSWDNKNTAIKALNNFYATYIVMDNFNTEIGHFTINKTNGYLAQYESKKNRYEDLFCGIGKVSREIKINNVDSSMNNRIKIINKLDLSNTVNQFEMIMKII